MILAQDIKSNINKIDFQLKELFEDVNIQEKSKGNQYYFEIKASSKFFNLNESNTWKKAQTMVRINKQDLVGEMVRWSYSVNPLQENADWIERFSNIERVGNEILETITKSRMDSEYLHSLNEVYSPLNESATEITKDDLVAKLKEIAKRFEIEISQVKKDKIVNEGYFTKADTSIKLFHNSDIKVSDKIKLESLFKSSGNVNWVLFREGFIELNVS